MERNGKKGNTGLSVFGEDQQVWNHPKSKVGFGHWEGIQFHQEVFLQRDELWKLNFDGLRVGELNKFNGL